MHTRAWTGRAFCPHSWTLWDSGPQPAAPSCPGLWLLASGLGSLGRRVASTPHPKVILYPPGLARVPGAVRHRPSPGAGAGGGGPLFSLRESLPPQIAFSWEQKGFWKQEPGGSAAKLPRGQTARAGRTYKLVSQKKKKNQPSTCPLKKFLFFKSLLSRSHRYKV